MPGFWGLEQNFLTTPLDKLDKKPVRSASIWDTACGSDGETSYSKDNPLLSHDVDVEKENYFLDFFLMGVYQEVLGTKHNLFTHPTEISVYIDENGYVLKDIIEAQPILDTLEDIDYDTYVIMDTLNGRISESSLADEKQKKHILGEPYPFLNDNDYLRSVSV